MKYGYAYLVNSSQYLSWKYCIKKTLINMDLSGLRDLGRVGKVSGKNAKVAKKYMKMKELEDIFGKLRSSILPKFQNHKQGGL